MYLSANTSRIYRPYVPYNILQSVPTFYQAPMNYIQNPPIMGYQNHNPLAVRNPVGVNQVVAPNNQLIAYGSQFHTSYLVPTTSLVPVVVFHIN